MRRHRLVVPLTPNRMGIQARKPNPLMKTYKFQLYSNHGNRELHKTIDGHAWVWNHCIALQRRYYAIYGKHISKFRLINHISKLKRLPRFAHWNQLPSQAIQDVVARVDKGYKAMFEARAQGLARKHRKIERQRNDFHWKLAHLLTDEYDEIRLETLNLQGMKALWGRKISDLGFADFVAKLKYIASKKGVKIVFIDKWYPSSKTCSACGAVNETLNLRDRTWQCSGCGATHDRDRNAAINIYRVGASTLDGEDVSGTPVPCPC